ncbi:MAG: hypothetical protein AABY47_10510, partial [Pseudomonadota bacterium]
LNAVCAALGFIGLPTLGFQLESAFMQGHYAEVSGLLLIFYGLIATLHWWGKIPILAIISDRRTLFRSGYQLQQSGF